MRLCGRADAIREGKAVRKILLTVLCCVLAAGGFAGCGTKKVGDTSIEIPKGEELKREMGRRRTLGTMPPPDAGEAVGGQAGSAE